MSEHIQHSERQEHRRVGLTGLMAEYLGDEEVSKLADMDTYDHQLRYVREFLIGFGEDPDEVFREFGVTEGDAHEA